MPETAHQWRRSRRCEVAHCVEFALTAEGSALVRDSKDPDGPHLRFHGRAWSAFVVALRRGEVGA